ncbi:MAG: alanine racemase [Chloroflexi bacterium]|nr:alanine racemase [Chloroflexota bacterium]
MRSWLEVNLKNIEFNLNQIENLTQKKAIPVIKANAYGLGSIEVAKYLSKKNFKLFAVANLQEALEIKNSGLDDKIFIMGNNDKDDLKLAIENGFSITISSWDDIKNLEKLKTSKEVLIHIKIDTGMGRIGFGSEDSYGVIKYINENKLGTIQGIYSHLSSADENEDEFTLEQINLFKKHEENKDIPFKHILNSPGIFKYSKYTNSNYVRPGISMYGILLFDTPLKKLLKPVFKLKTKVIYIKTLSNNAFISYGKTAEGKKGDIIATLPIGYADGLDRRFSNGGTVKIHGEKYTIIGRICMDMTMIIIPNNLKNKVGIGTEVEIYGEDINEQAQSIGSIADELMTRINKRVSRRYV